MTSRKIRSLSTVLGLLLASFLLCAVATAGEIRCNITSKFACGPQGCEAVQLGMWNVVDLDRGHFSRCGQKGCDIYDAEISKSGLFYVIEVGGGALAKMAIDGSTYLEVVTIGTLVLLSFGSCR